MTLKATRHRLRRLFLAWALRQRKEEATPVIFTRQRIYVLPTRAGMLYAVTLLVLLLVAINYQMSLGYALVFMLSSVGIVSILHSHRNLAGLSLSCGVAEPVFAGDKACFPLLLSTVAGRRRPRLRLGLPGLPPVAAEAPANGVARVDLTLPAPHRGWLQLPLITVDSNWPLALVRAWGYAAPARRCLVFAAPANDDTPPRSGGDHHGGEFSSDSGDEDFAGLRRHQPGDPPHHVAWKAVARLDASAPLQTKQFAGAGGETLWLDWNALPQGMGVEARLSLLTRQVLDVAAAGNSWGLRLPGKEFAVTHGAAHRRRCLQAIALYGL